MGDQVLKLVARTMTECVKGQDTPARYGGEEFGIILPKTKLEQAIHVGNELRERLASKKMINRKNGSDLGTITLSLGAAKYRYGEPLNQWVHRADEALYLAKRSGRNQVKSESDLEEGALDLQDTA
jgi:diguanylate cyclase